MRIFSVAVTCMLQVATYDIFTTDRKKFTCIKRADGQDSLCPLPEEVVLSLGEEPKPAIWGSTFSGLYTDLQRQVQRYLDLEHQD